MPSRSSSRSVEPPKSYPDPSPSSSTFAILRAITAEQGVAGVFSGVGLRVARVGPACAIMISSYELGKLFFAQQEVVR